MCHLFDRPASASSFINSSAWKTQTSQRPLPSLCFSGWSEKQDGRPGLSFAETFSTSSLKRLNVIQRNLTGSKIYTYSTKFVFFGAIGKTRWPPWPLIGWDILNFSETAEQNSRKLCRKQDGRGRWDLASYKVSLNSVQQFQRRSWKCLSQLEARAAILFFRSARKTKIGRGSWDLASCQVSLNSIKRFQRSSRKCLSQSEARAAILFFRLARKTQTW